MLGAEGADDPQAGRGNIFKEPAARGRGVGEPDAQELEVGLNEESTAVVGPVYAEDFGAWHGGAVMATT